MATFTYQLPSAETFNGGAGNDLFVGSNNFFGAGDRAFGGDGIDEFLYFADPSLTVDAAPKTVPAGFAVGPTKTFAAFQLNAVEVVTVTNDSGAVLVFDMSSSAGITDLVSANSSDGVIFDQVTELSNIRLVNQTFVATADVGVGFQAAVLAGANTTANLVLQNTSSDVVRIGGTGGTLGNIGNTGVENVTLTVIGNTNSSIATLDTALTSLVILDDAASTGGVTIQNTLAGTVRTVDNQSDGSATISAAAATGAVTFTGVGGNETFTGGAFNDPVFETKWKELQASSGDEFQRLAKALDLYVIQQHNYLWGPIVPGYTATQPWLVSYNGEMQMGNCGWTEPYARMWVDSQLKDEMN